MAQIGSFGSLVFEVSGRKVRTFSEIEERASGRWTQHEPIGQEVLSEYLGPGQDEVVLTIVFTTMLGTDPDLDYNLVRRYARSGEHLPLVLNGVPLHNKTWYIVDVDCTSSEFAAKEGAALWRECVVNFREYN